MTGVPLSVGHLSTISVQWFKNSLWWVLRLLPFGLNRWRHRRISFGNRGTFSSFKCRICQRSKRPAKISEFSSKYMTTNLATILHRMIWRRTNICSAKKVLHPLHSYIQIGEIIIVSPAFIPGRCTDQCDGFVSRQFSILQNSCSIENSKWWCRRHVRFRPIGSIYITFVLYFTVKTVSEIARGGRSQRQSFHAAKWSGQC